MGPSEEGESQVMGRARPKVLRQAEAWWLRAQKESQLVGLTSVPPTRKLGGSDKGLSFVLIAETGGLDAPPSAAEITCHRWRHGFVQSA